MFNKAIGDYRHSLSIMHIHVVSSQCTFDAMTYFDGIFFLSPNCEESLNKFLSQDPDLDPDHLRGEPMHAYNTSCVKTSRQSEQ